jgi:hypothetical protein
MTRLSEALKRAGIDDPGAEDALPTWDELHLRQLEEDRDQIEARIRQAKERAERDKARLVEQDRARRERLEAERRERQRRAQRVVGFYRELGVYGIAVKPVDCWSARCRETPPQRVDGPAGASRAGRPPSPARLRALEGRRWASISLMALSQSAYAP